MKLELKHLAPYLPYGLKCKVDNDKIISTIIGIEKGYEDKYGWFWITCAKRFANGTSFNRQSSNIINPILHPLSDLTKPIKVEGYNDGFMLANYGGPAVFCGVSMEWKSDPIISDPFPTKEDAVKAGLSS